MAGHNTAECSDEDRCFDLRALAEYSGLSIRTLQRHIVDPDNPLPTHHVCVKGKGRGRVLVLKREFDAWVRRFPAVGEEPRSVSPMLQTSVDWEKRLGLK